MKPQFTQSADRLINSNFPVEKTSRLVLAFLLLLAIIFSTVLSAQSQSAIKEPDLTKSAVVRVFSILRKNGKKYVETIYVANISTGTLNIDSCFAQLVAITPEQKRLTKGAGLGYGGTTKRDGSPLARVLPAQGVFEAFKVEWAQPPTVGTETGSVEIVLAQKASSDRKSINISKYERLFYKD